MTEDFQCRVSAWVLDCFGRGDSYNVEQRNWRFLEEALELVQSLGCHREAAHALVDYVFERPAGDPKQEVGGVLLTLAALCTVSRISANACGEDELARVWSCIDRIRAKHASKPDFSSLPGVAPAGLV